MDVRQYIESGILELYVFGQLTDSERADVEAMAAQHPEVRAEIAEIEQSLELYARMHGINPSPGTLDQILEKTNDGTASAASPKSDVKKNSRPTWLTWLLALGFLLAIGSALFFYNRYRQAQGQLSETQSSYDDYKVYCDSLSTENQLLDRQMSILRDRNFRSVRMEGTDNAPDAIATVHINSEKNEAWLDPISMPAPPAGKDYQLWAIVDDKPVDMGVFNLPENVLNWKKIPYIENAQAFAVTLEPKGGKPAPTLEQMVVMGKVG